MGRQAQIDTSEGQNLDPAILGDILGYLSMESHERAECLSSALVVGKQAGPPGRGSATFSRDWV